MSGVAGMRGEELLDDQALAESWPMGEELDDEDAAPSAPSSRKGSKRPDHRGVGNEQLLRKKGSKEPPSKRNFTDRGKTRMFSYKKVVYKS